MIILICIILFVLFFYFSLQAKNTESVSKMKSDIEVEREYLRQLNVQFTYEHSYKSLTRHKGILFVVDEKNKYAYVCEEPYKSLQIPFSEIIGVEIIIDSQVAGGVGRAIVGGVLAGDAGAIVGATTAKKKIFLYKVTIVRENITDPQTDIVLIDSETKTDSFEYQQARQFAEGVQSSLRAIISMNESSKNMSANADIYRAPVNYVNVPAPINGYVADELLKLKTLLDSGVLTPEEFEQQKQKILGMGDK